MSASGYLGRAGVEHIGCARTCNVSEITRVHGIGLVVRSHLSKPKAIAKTAFVRIVGMRTYDRTAAKNGLKAQRLGTNIAQSEHAALAAGQK